MFAATTENGDVFVENKALGFTNFLDRVLNDPLAVIVAHNANFERTVLSSLCEMELPVEKFKCSQAKAAYCGMPLSLDNLSKALELEELGKKSEGRALIKKFCTPQKPTKRNGFKERIQPEDDPEAWEMFIEYCRYDVMAEMAVLKRLESIEVPSSETELYRLDQLINDRGIETDGPFVQAALAVYEEHSQKLKAEFKSLTGLENPNSPSQLKEWLLDQTGIEVESLAKGNIPIDLVEDDGAVGQALAFRSELSKTSISKYKSMSLAKGFLGRIRGMFQYYGANRTGRWAGRLVQLQNLKRNYLKYLEFCKKSILSRDYDLIQLDVGDISDTLSQLIRTALIAKEGHSFCVADFSAIEARVIAWLSEENWRLEVFRDSGKIYEASASKMFNVPVEEIGKGSDLRAKGKVAELALGYGGGVGSLIAMGGEDMGLSESDMNTIKVKWRKASPKIVRMWTRLERAAILAVTHGIEVDSKVKGIKIGIHKNGLGDKWMYITLPEGRSLYYYNPRLYKNKWGNTAVKYMDMHEGQWKWVSTYGGKLTENVTQAVARDCLVFAMFNLEAKGFEIILHVHDEVATEENTSEAERKLEEICDIMSKPIPWADGLPLDADGYITKFYKKD